ncbi:MAG: hypothetical protein AABZ53_01440 [Planctomycetota bacterium]
MAGRTSTSVGVGVTITLLGISTLALFVLFGVYFGKYNAIKQDYDTKEKTNEQFITSGERNDATMRAMQSEAQKERKSLVGYFVSKTQGLSRSIAGVEGLSFKDLDIKIRERAGADNSPLLTIVANKDEEIAGLKNEVAKADDSRKAAVTELERVRGAVGDTQKTLATENAKLKTQITGYETELGNYRSGLGDATTKMKDAIKLLEAESAERTKRLEGKIAGLERDNLIITELVAKLRGEQSKELLKGQNEEALVDGTIVGLLPAQNQVSISVGRKQKVQLGMSFTVYAEAKQIKIDEKTNEYKRGKATLEVINVGEDTSICRITSETKGTPAVKGDVIANAIYDPAKVYKFVVFGNFDTNGDAESTPGERGDVVTMIQSWNGKVIDELAGDVDFLVLGERPLLPPKPGVDVPYEVVQQYVRIEREAARYDEYYKAAQASSVPVLNQNRLFTLIGKPMGRNR